MEAFAQFVPLILIFAIMYFLLIRPQQRKLKDHKKMVESLRRGDMVVTQGGLIGKVTKVKEDNELEVEYQKACRFEWFSPPLRRFCQRRNRRLNVFVEFLCCK